MYFGQAQYDNAYPYDDRQEAFEEAVTKKAEELMNDEYCPTNLANILEALGEAKNETMESIEQALKAKNPTVFDLINDASFEYWAKLAEAKAERILTSDQ